MDAENNHRFLSTLLPSLRGGNADEAIQGRQVPCWHPLDCFASLAMTFLSMGFLILALPSPAFAGQAEVRDVARVNNCPPKKIEVYQQILGDAGETVYRVECVLPKVVGGDKDAPQPSAMLISCVQNLCIMLRPIADTKK